MRTVLPQITQGLSDRRSMPAKTSRAAAPKCATRVVGDAVEERAGEVLGAKGNYGSCVHQIVCKPDWDRHGRAAPFRRNDELLNLLPKGVIAFPGSGITENDKAKTMGIPVMRAAA